MTQTLMKSADQYLIKQAVTWEQFKALQSAFAEIGGVKLNYCAGLLEIVEIECLLIESQLDAMLAFQERYQ